MNILTFLNVAIGVMIIYLILSLLISEIQESITAILELRARDLRSSLVNLLDGKTKHDDPAKAEIMAALYNTSLIKSLNQGRKSSLGPSYIPKEVFAAALIEVLKTRYNMSMTGDESMEVICQKIDAKLQQYESPAASPFVDIPEMTPADLAAVTPAQTNPEELPHQQFSEYPTGPSGYPPVYDPSVGLGAESPTDQPIPTSAEFTPSPQPTVEPIAGATIPSQPSPAPEEITDSDIYFLQNLSTLAERVKANVKKTEAGIDQFQKALAEWFDNSMARASGTYKRNAKAFSFLLGLGVAVVVNVDTINMVDRLYKNQALSDSVAQLADQVVSTNPQVVDQLNQAKSNQEREAAIAPIRSNLNYVLDQVSAFPIGWNLPSDFQVSPQTWLLRLAGWFVSALAFSMGAPFWFETLSKFINVRNAGQKPPSKEPPSEQIF
jgi:hypothetical protein